MKIRFVKDSEYTVSDSNGDVHDRVFRRWQEINVQDVVQVGGHHFTVVLPDGAEILDVREDSFQVVDKT